MEMNTEQTLYSTRQTEIDIAKGIGIILVVWAHAYGPLLHYITQFHMPFFFFVSGLLYASVDVSGKDYLLRKCKSLLLPFWYWNILFFPVFFILFYWKNWSVDTFVKGIAGIVFTLDKVPFLGATWFLPALFWISVTVHFGIRIFRKYRFCDACILAGGIAACVLGFSITFPYRISRTLICSLFYVCGYLYRKYLKDAVGDRIKNISAVVGGLIFIIIASFNSVSLGNNEYQYKIAFIVGALSATAFILRVSRWISESLSIRRLLNHLAYIGRNSMCIVIWHLLAFRVTIILQILVLRADISSIVAFPVYDASGIWWLLYLVVGIYISLGWQYVLEHNPLSSLMRRIHMI